MTVAYSLNILACNLNTLAYSLNTLAYMLNTFAYMLLSGSRCDMVLIALGVVRALGSPLFLLGPSTYYIEEKLFGQRSVSGPAENIIFSIIVLGF